MGDVTKNANLAFRQSSDGAGSADGKIMFRGPDIRPQDGDGLGVTSRGADIRAQHGRGEKEQDQGGNTPFGIKSSHWDVSSFRYLKI